MSYLLNAFSEADYNAIKPINNYILVRLPEDTGKPIHKHKSGLLISSNFSSEETYSPCYGEVVKKGAAVDRRVQEGDTVFFHYLCYINARNTTEQYNNGNYDPQKSLFEYNDRLYLLMTIDNAYFVKRGDELISINDQVLLRSIPKKLEKVDVEHNGEKWSVLVGNDEGNILTTSIKEAYRLDVAEVISAPEDCNLVKGDIIAPPKDWDVPLEYDMLAILKEPVYFLDKEYAFNIKEFGLTKESLGIS